MDSQRSSAGGGCGGGGGCDDDDAFVPPATGGAPLASQNSSRSSTDETNLIKTCIEKHFDSESYAKFQQVLEYTDEKLRCGPAFALYNDNLMEQFKAMSAYEPYLPEGYTLDVHIRLKIKFYSFRFIANVGQDLLKKLSAGKPGAEQHFTRLTKILLYHALTSKSDTANLALVELEQLCKKRPIELWELFDAHRAKYLRSIIKAILHKLNSREPVSVVDRSKSDSDTTNASATIDVSQLSEGKECGNDGYGCPPNPVIVYMKRAFDVFSVPTITNDDFAQSLIILTNLIHKEKFNNAIKSFLKYLAAFKRIDMYTLIRNHIHTIMVNLFLKGRLSKPDMTASLAKLGSFCDKTAKEMLDDKYSAIKGRLILYYSSDPGKVKDGVYFLSKFEKSELDQPFENQFDDDGHFIDYLNPDMIGILLNVDFHFQSNKKDFGSEESLKQVASLCKMISALDGQHVEVIHVKLLSSLSLLLSLRNERDNQSLNQVLAGLWRTFVSKLNKELKFSLAINICIALYDLIEDSPDDVVDIYEKLICRDVSNEFKAKLKSLFFIPDVPAMGKIYAYLTQYIERNESFQSISQLHAALDSVLGVMKMENQKGRLLALLKLKRLLCANQQLILTTMLTNPEEPLAEPLSKIIEALLQLSSSHVSECSALIAECLGILGAVNPVRLDQLVYGGTSGTSGATPTSIDLTSCEFIREVIERLKCSLFSDRLSESEAANYALQVIVSNYDVFKHKALLRSLSPEALKACQLCRDTSYDGTKASNVDGTTSIYEKFKCENQYSYKEWLDKFFVTIASTIDSKAVRNALYACSYVFRYNVSLAEFLLPQTIAYIVHYQLKNSEIIQREIMAILQEEVRVSTQDLDTVYTEDDHGNLQTLHFQCASIIFCTLDLLHRLSSEAKLPPKTAAKTLTVSRLDAFLNTIPKDKLGSLAGQCRSFARALWYFEQFLYETGTGIDKYATALQRIYVSLDDTFEALGAEMVRGTACGIADEIINHEACGQFDKASICSATYLETLRGSDCDDREPIIEDSLRNLSSQGNHQRLYVHSKQFLAEYPHYRRTILPYAVEAMTKMSRWDELNDTFKEKQQMSSLLDSPPGVKGYLLTSPTLCRESLPQKLKLVRQKLMKPLSIALLDRSAYYRGYQNLLVLHSVGDLSLASDVFDQNEIENQRLDENTIEDMRRLLNTKFDSVRNWWTRRNKLVQPSLKSIEPLQEWQRTMALALAKKYPYLRERVDIDIGDMWLDSADAAREAGTFDRAFFCLTQARKSFASRFDSLSLNLQVRFYIQKAKLDWDQGERTAAMRSLKSSLKRLRDHNLYQHLITRKPKYHSNADPFPQLNNLVPCSLCEKIERTERESFAQLKILLTQYCEEAAAGLPENLFYMYEECVHLGVNQEETYLHLARYYDKLLAYYTENPNLCVAAPEKFDSTQRLSQNLMGGDKLEVYSKLMEHSIIAFGNSLLYGVKYLRESMPRMLNIWYDLGNKKSRNSGQGALPRSVSSRIENTIRFIDMLMKKLPPYYFMAAVSILLSSVTHPHSGISQKTMEILESLLSAYPHQMTWLLIAMSKDEFNKDRKKKGSEIFNNVCKKPSKARKIVKDTWDLAKVMVKLCRDSNELRRKDDRREPSRAGPCLLKDISPEAGHFDFNSTQIIAPINASIRALFPTGLDGVSPKDHAVYPESNMYYISAFKPEARVFSSMQRPVQVGLLCENGKTINLLCKHGDDLRKDSRCAEFLDFLNRILRKNSQSNARFFEIQTYMILPLNFERGIIEMVPNCESLKNLMDPMYKERKANVFLCKQTTSDPNKLLAIFTNKLLPMAAPPVLPQWFLRRFTEPTSWYTARSAFTRTAAVSSMAGYIIGLGDRHLDNILVDTGNGRVVHVDFNLLFHQGELLNVPERVPFRLTQNMVAAFGSMGTEGNFRKVCEITMRVMRKEKDALLTTLKPFMLDPCSEWMKCGRQQGDTENNPAKYRIEVSERKLRGFPRSRKFKPLTLIDSYSVEAQVDTLIEEATDNFHLAQMYFGWCAHV